MTTPTGPQEALTFSVVSAGTRLVQRLVEEPNYKWFCEREDCGWSGDGYTSSVDAERGAERHQADDHRPCRYCGHPMGTHNGPYCMKPPATPADGQPS